MKAVTDRLWGALGEFVGAALAFNVKVAAFLAGVLLLFGPFYLYVHWPLAQADCRAIADRSGGRFNPCAIGTKIFLWAGETLDAVFGVGGSGGALAESQVTPPASAFDNNHPTPVATPVRNAIPASEILVSTELPDGQVVAVLGVEVWQYSRPYESSDNLAGRWDTVANPQIKVWAVVRTAENRLWVRTKEKNHPQGATYMRWEDVENSTLPQPQLPTPTPLPILLPQDPWGPLEYSGAPPAETVDALNKWRQYRSGVFTVDDELVSTLGELRTISPEWEALYQKVQNAESLASSFQQRVGASSPSTDVRSLLVQMGEQNMSVRVVEVGRRGWVDNGTQPVVLQPMIVLNEAEYPVGESFDVPIKVLRQLGHQVEPGSVLEVK